MRPFLLWIVSALVLIALPALGETSPPAGPTSLPSGAGEQGSILPSNAAPGASGAPGAGASNLEIPKGSLGPEYLDGSFGFGVRPLARMDRRKRTVEGRVQLAQFVRLEIGWSMAVRLWISSRPMDVTAARQGMTADLSAQYADLAITSAEAVRVASREAVRLAATFSTDGQTWLRQQAVVPLRQDQYVLIVLTTPGDDRELAAGTFGQILDSFKVVRTQVQQEQLDAALRRGEALLSRIAGPDAKLAAKAMDKPVCLRMTREGKPIGFVGIQEQPASLEHKEGLQILQGAWLFNPDESVQFAQENKFVANDLTYDEWRNVSQLMPSPQVDPKQRLVVSVEGGIRRNDQLVVEYVGQLGAAEKQDKVIAVEPSFTGAAWPLLLPRLVDLSKPELYAFSMYDSERRGLILRVFRVAGPTQVLVGGRRVPAFKIEDSEGLLPPVNEIDVDPKGGILRLASGPVEMTLTTQADAEKEFGPRVKAAQDRFHQNAGMPLEAPPAAKNPAKSGAAEPQPAQPRPRRSVFPRPPGKPPALRQGR